MAKSLKHPARSTVLHKRPLDADPAAQPLEFAGPAVGEPWPALDDADVHWPSALESHLEYSSETRPGHSIKKLAIHLRVTHVVFVFVLALIGLGYALATNNPQLVSAVLHWSKYDMHPSLSP